MEISDKLPKVKDPCFKSPGLVFELLFGNNDDSLSLMDPSTKAEHEKAVQRLKQRFCQVLGLPQNASDSQIFETIMETNKRRITDFIDKK